MKYIVIIIALFTFYSGNALNLQDVERIRFRDSIESILNYRTGIINLIETKVRLFVPPGFQFLDAPQASLFFPGIMNRVKPSGFIGILVPFEGSPFDPRNERYIIWADKQLVIDKESFNGEQFHVKERKTKDTVFLDFMLPPFYDTENSVIGFQSSYLTLLDSILRFRTHLFFISPYGTVFIESDHVGYDSQQVIQRLPLILSSIVSDETENKENVALNNWRVLLPKEILDLTVQKNEKKVSYSSWMVSIVFILSLIYFVKKKCIKR